jgi:pimeloyl-ACP methyl ester carboxylesterase
MHLDDFGGAGAVLHLAPANGFPPQTYLPLLRPFLGDHRAVCLPPRALWETEQPPEQRRRWDWLAEDLINGLREHDLRDVIALGHSFGGVASLLAVLAEPERFRALCLLDVTIFPPEWMRVMAQMQADGSIRDFPLAAGAKRRRRAFESVEAAYHYFKTRPLFKDWPDETVRLYAESGTRPTPQGVELVWSPEWEAYYFMTAYTDTWEALPKLRGKLPILTIRGGETDTLVPETVERMQTLLPEMEYAEVPGHGHLFPQSAPEATAAIIRPWLAKV